MARDSEIIEYDPEEIEIIAKMIRNRAERYAELYHKLYSVVFDLMDSFKGIDARVFFDKISGFRRNFDAMYAVMIEYADYLDRAAKMLRSGMLDRMEAARRLHGGF